MRITIVIGAFFPLPPAPTGAIEKVWDALSKVFAARGHEVTILCPAAAGESTDETRGGIRYLRLPRRGRTGSTRLDLIKDLGYSISARRRLPAADVTVTNCFWLPILLRFGKRSIGALNVHAQRFPRGQFGLYRSAARISTVSDAIAQAIREQTPEVAPRIRVIPNPVDTGVFRPEGPVRRIGPEPTILYTGRIHPEKGLHLLVEAYARLRRRLPTLRLRLVGPSEISRGGGGEAFLGRLRSLAGDAEIEFGANIADAGELAATLRGCDVYCSPSIAYYGEASPVAPLEAMASGAVPVVSDLPQFAGYVRDGETGLVFPREAPDAVDRLAMALERVLVDEDLRRRLRDAGVGLAQSFAVERIAEAYLADFAELVEANPRTRTPSP